MYLPYKVLMNFSIYYSLSEMRAWLYGHAFLMHILCVRTFTVWIMMHLFTNIYAMVVLSFREIPWLFLFCNLYIRMVCSL